jgi:voltage-gated potassium channel
LLFSFAVLLVTIFSTMVIYNVTHNLYTSVYYSTSMIFDMEAYDSGSEIAAVVPPFTEEFDLVLAISLFDGIVKAAIVGFVLASLVKFLTTINLSARLNSAVARRLKGHVIVCGYSMLAERLCKDLKAAGLQYLVIDSNPEKAQRLEELGNLVLNRDFTDRSALEAASVKRAAAIIFATEDDFTNLLGVVTAKHMQPNLKIITRAADWANISKMKRGGAKMCLVPEIVAGQELGRKLLGLWST